MDEITITEAGWAWKVPNFTFSPFLAAQNLSHTQTFKYMSQAQFSSLKQGHWHLLFVLALIVLSYCRFAWYKIIFVIRCELIDNWEKYAYEPFLRDVLASLLSWCCTSCSWWLVAVAVWSDILLLTNAHRGESNNNQEKVLIMS